MAIDHHSDHIVARPGEVVGATDPGRPETREGHNNTGREGLARLLTRRRLLFGAAGAGALFLTGGTGAYLATRDGDAAAMQTDEHVNQNGPETGPVFEKDLALNQMKLPETLDAPTFGVVTENLGLAIQYAVNNNDPDLLRRLIPGGHLNALQPGQFELRAAFLEGYRESSRGTMNDDPNNPNDTRYYPWGFDIELIELLNRKKDEPTDERVTGFIGKVRIRMGDLPPLTTMQSTDARVEPPKEFEAEAAFTRIAKLNKDGTYNILPDLDGTGRGWGLANISQMYPVPKFMTGSHLPGGFTEVPDLYKN